MKTKKTLYSLHGLILAGAAAFSLTGCITSGDNKVASDYNSDGSGSFFTSEIDQMGQTLNDNSAPAAKVGVADTITGELVIQPFTYSADCKCFVRTATFTNSNGYERLRVDSVTLVDTNGDTLSVFNRKAMGKAFHKRHVTRTKGGMDFDVVFNMEVDIKMEGANKVGVWNGTMSGTFNGEPFKSATITNVTRVLTNGRFQFAESGTVEIDRPVFHFLLEFLGGGDAKLTITNKLNHKVHIITIDRDYKESAPVAQ